ncbi:Monoterpene epsilon-lactone hydrolase [Halioglobus japonicus]|nr:Monoterpene epsilon-lactone hydrolase [Halioglobus japonicus]
MNTHQSALNTHIPQSNNNGAADIIVFREMAVSRRTTVILWFMRVFAKRLLAMMGRFSPERLTKMQLRTASMACKDNSGIPIAYDIVGTQPGHIFGSLGNTSRPVILWLHGGAFSLPAAPDMHLRMVANLCRQLDADAFMPDYRLTPANPYPAGLDDCEAAYRELLALGYDASDIAMGGDSAGGNLLMALFQRIRKAGLPMPACAVPVSPVTELSRVHGLPSRHKISKSDPLLPASAMQRMCSEYAGDRDTTHPEISPIYMDCSGLPPLFFLASSNEILMDDTVYLARRASAAGVDTTCHIWPMLPHAFPLFAGIFPEAVAPRDDMAKFMGQHLRRTKAS